MAALRKGDLWSLGAVRHEGMVWMSDMCSPEEMVAVLGVGRLSVIMLSTRLALLVMTQANEEDHCADPRDPMARARRVCWIPRSRALALRVIKNCGHCRRGRKQVPEEIMGDLPSYKQLPTAPFTAVGCDFMGPYMVKVICSGRRQFKV